MTDERNIYISLVAHMGEEVGVYHEDALDWAIRWAKYGDKDHVHIYSEADIELAIIKAEEDRTP